MVIRDNVQRQQVIDTCLAMNRAGINQGMSGNVSIRTSGGCLITPSGVAYDSMLPEQIVALDTAGDIDTANTHASKPPSSEWRMHVDIYSRFADAGAVVHAHPPHATALACLNRGIPAFHYMVAIAGGRNIRCASYATFGSAELSINMLNALDGRFACLLANHGMICYGKDIDQALWRAIELEALAQQYLLALGVGEPVLLDDVQMAEVEARFAGYGRSSD
ncbi:MAG: fuculose phosphate aldolase [marine bacterium B5-7]|nr:MAG: fuculose phosphate aldolase [marine bacterium B5-7]